MRLEGSVLVITEAAHGIGRETSFLFARESSAVVVVDINEEAGRRTADEIQSASDQAIFVSADVSKEADCQRMIVTDEETFGIPALRRAGGGSIINTASFVALVGATTSQLAYTARKGGVVALTRELAVVSPGKHPRQCALPWPFKN